MARDTRTGKARQGTHPTAGRPEHFANLDANLYKTESGQAAQKVLSQAGRDGKRVDIQVIDKNGNKHTVVSNTWKGHPNREPGKDAKWVKREAGKTSSDIKDFLAQQSGYGDPARSDSWGKPLVPREIAEIQILVYN